MRNIWKVALAFTVALGLGALAQAQLIVGNTAAFGCGPIMTSDFSLATVTHQFYPDGAGGTDCPTPVNLHNGRGMALGGGGGIFRLFYTELDEIPGVGGQSGFGPSEFIHVANFNNGDGSGDIALFPNPRPGSGIQDLTIANGDLYVLTGYDTQVPQVFVLNTFTGAVKSGPITVPRVGFTDNGVDGFAVLPNGNFLMNNGSGANVNSCIYAEYDKTDGHFIGPPFTVPNAARCTGVDTDGTSLYFMTDFTAITRMDVTTHLVTGFSSWNSPPGGEDFIEDISVVHPITVITGGGDGHFWFSLINSDDNSVRYDLRAEVLLNGTVIGGGILRCQIPLPNQGSPKDFVIPVSLPASVVLQSGDVISARLSTRAGTTITDSLCGGPTRAVGIRFYYDSGVNASQFPLIISPATTGTKFYFHSDGTACKSGGTVVESGPPPPVLTRTLSDVAPTGATKCKHSDSFPGVVGGVNPWIYFNVPTNTIGSVPALWQRAAQP